MSDERFDISGYDAEIAAKDGMRYSLRNQFISLPNKLAQETESAALTL